MDLSSYGLSSPAPPLMSHEALRCVALLLFLSTRWLCPRIGQAFPPQSEKPSAVTVCVRMSLFVILCMSR